MFAWIPGEVHNEAPALSISNKRLSGRNADSGYAFPTQRESCCADVKGER
jgi:hypothetical protein